MRKIYFLAFLFIFLLSFNFFSSIAYALEENLIASPSSQSEEVDYALPYPGLLPDSPLYFLRIIRDKTVGFLISDPLRKAEFDLLQADKRLNAGIYLFNKGKISLALSTVSKAENYFEQALNKVDEAKKQGSDVGEMRGKLTSALRKHKQEINSFVKKADAKFTGNFKKEQQRIVNFEERLSR